ncbi:ankyrin repeat, SAM and basic leucine zipper domain-containing protein 1-like isoform X2 [Lineus longissimus]|uniref:ankyrin repeat, SAM and basic leucine zipper domain-containing protein 1-like isoform X2 n=1 Tax=Lineus longissimus TaxID=88925 RepID=UPI00315DD124
MDEESLVPMVMGQTKEKKKKKIRFQIGILNHVDITPTPGKGRQNAFNSSNNGFSDSRRNKSPYRAFSGRSSLPVDDFRMAVMKGNVEMIQRYLNDGVAVDTVMKSGWTALMYAASCANKDMVKILLENGADMGFHKDQYDVLMAACGSNQTNADAVTECVALLLDAGADVNRFDRYHMTPLMYAAREGRVDIITMLVEFGSDVNKQDWRGWTALVYATSRGHNKALAELLKLKADPNTRCSNGETASDIAYSMGHYKVADMLSKYSSQNKDDAILTAMSVYERDAGGDSQSSESQALYEKYGELEMFLSGIELSDLIPVFRSQRVTFAAFLRMTDNDLQQIGVQRIGVRKKILDSIQSVHKKPWEKSSLQSVQYNNFISCADAVTMVNNISKHTDYITSTVGYIKDQIIANAAILARDQEGTGMKMLCKSTDQSLVNIQDLYKELSELREHLNKVKDDPCYRPSDLIEGKSRRKRQRWPFLVLGLGTLVGIGIWKRDFVLEKGAGILTRLTFR